VTVTASLDSVEPGAYVARGETALTYEPVAGVLVADQPSLATPLVVPVLSSQPSGEASPEASAARPAATPAVVPLLSADQAADHAPIQELAPRVSVLSAATAITVPRPTIVPVRTPNT
jgi:hypothetical protein